MNQLSRPERMLSTTEAANRLGVDEQTVRDMCDDGRLPCQRNTKNHRRIPEGSVEVERLKRGPSGRSRRPRRGFQATVTADVEGVLSDAAIDLICDGVAARIEQRDTTLIDAAERLTRTEEALNEAVRRIPLWRRRRFVALLRARGVLPRPS